MNPNIHIDVYLLFILSLMTIVVYGKNHLKCHLVELEHCFDKLHQLKDAQHDPSFLLTSHQGLDKICRVIKDDFNGCVLDYLQRCGTPLHKELSKVVSDAVLEHMNMICSATSDFRNEVLKKSPCIHEKILSQVDFQRECNNPFFTTIAWGEMKAHSLKLDASPFDYVVDAGCCAYRKWENCALPKIREKCSENAEDILSKVVSKILGGVTNFLCYQQDFTENSKLCSSLPSMDEQLSQANITYADTQKFSVFSMLKMFLVRADSK